jgi:AP-3 complex subunit mu
MVVEDVAVTIPFPRAVRTTNLTVSMGQVIYDEAQKVARWTIGKLDGQKKPQLQGTMVLEGSRKPAEEQNLSLNWKIPLASVSGLSVSGLSLTGESYSVYKGVRNITKTGRFQVRCN